MKVSVIQIKCIKCGKTAMILAPTETPSLCTECQLERLRIRLND